MEIYSEYSVVSLFNGFLHRTCGFAEAMLMVFALIVHYFVSTDQAETFSNCVKVQIETRYVWIFRKFN